MVINVVITIKRHSQHSSTTMPSKLPIIIQPPPNVLTRAEYQKLADVPPELEWFANIDNAKTRRAYKIDIEDFTSLMGIRAPEAMRPVTRAHVLA